MQNSEVDEETEGCEIYIENRVIVRLVLKSWDSRQNCWELAGLSKLYSRSKVFLLSVQTNKYFLTHDFCHFVAVFIC